MSPENPNPAGGKPEDRAIARQNEERADVERPEEARPSERDERNNNNKDQIVAAQDVEDFFQRLPGNFRWPKPNAEAVAAAVEAIQRMSGSVAAENLAAAVAAESVAWRRDRSYTIWRSCRATGATYRHRQSLRRGRPRRSDPSLG